jgi:hypothetical protein
MPQNIALITQSILLMVKPPGILDSFSPKMDRLSQLCPDGLGGYILHIFLSTTRFIPPFLEASAVVLGGRYRRFRRALSSMLELYSANSINPQDEILVILAEIRKGRVEISCDIKGLSVYQNRNSVFRATPYL